MRVRSLRNKGKVAALAAFLLFKPLAASAQEEEKKPQPLPAGTELSEEKPKEAEAPKDDVGDIEFSEEREIKFDDEKPAPKPKAKPADKPAEVEEPVEEPAEEIPKYDEVQVDPEHDQYVGIYNPNVDMSGQMRDIHLNHVWDIGGNVVANEAGSSVYGSLSHRFARKDNIFATRLNLNAGNIWFGEQPAPFLRAFASPEVNLWRFRGATYTSIALMANMPSVAYMYQSGGLGYSQKFDKNDMRLRIGAVGGFALSVNKFDDMYANFAAGASFEIEKHLVYAIPRFYFAASDPIKVAYYSHYSPRFQGIETGFQVRFYEDQYASRIFLDIDRLYQRVGGRLTRQINFSQTVTGDIYGGLAATHWSTRIGGRWDPGVFAGISITVGGKYVNSTNTFRYERLTSGGITRIDTDFPTRADPGPYGFGREGSEAWRETVNTAKERMVNSSSFEEFSSSYHGDSQEEIVRTGRFMSAFMLQAAYANQAYEDLSQGNILSSEAQRVSNANTDMIFSYTQAMVDFYENNPPSTPLPRELANGITMCGGIHHMVSEFYRSNGIRSLTVSVNTPNGPHMVAIPLADNFTSLIDYGSEYRAGPNRFDEVIRMYGRAKKAPVFQSQIFDGNGYVGTYTTAEGNLLHDSVGVDNVDLLKKDFLNVR